MDSGKVPYHNNAGIVVIPVRGGDVTVRAYAHAEPQPRQLSPAAKPRSEVMRRIQQLHSYLLLIPKLATSL
jgi:hypothetical protein